MNQNSMANTTTPQRPSDVSGDRNAAAGFTLIEVAMALVIILIALLGVVFTFTYVINYNAGNNARSQALAVLQQEVELLRAAKFTPTITDPALTGGTKDPKLVASPSGGQFTVTITVDNNPLVGGIQDETTPTSLKEIRVITNLAAPSPGWQTAVPAMVVLRRTRAN